MDGARVRRRPARRARRRQERNAAVRRAELLLAAGGDPHRPLELYGRAATALAADLDSPEARASLADGLAELGAGHATGCAGRERRCGCCAPTPTLRGSTYAAAVLADELGSEDEASSGSST